MLVSGAICGVLYATFAGQPLTIVGATGPLMVFETIVYHLCRWVETVVMTKLSLFDPPIFVLLLSFHLPYPPFLLYLSSFLSVSSHFFWILHISNHSPPFLLNFIAISFESLVFLHFPPFFHLHHFLTFTPFSCCFQIKLKAYHVSVLIWPYIAAYYVA